MTNEEIVVLFVGMTPVQEQIFLAAYAHELTILARMYFVDESYQEAKYCNESLHLLTGYMGSSPLRKPETTAATDVSFIETIVEYAKHRGWSEIVTRSLQHSLAITAP
jgi:hypothetical protein